MWPWDCWRWRSFEPGEGLLYAHHGSRYKHKKDCCHMHFQETFGFFSTMEGLETSNAIFGAWTLRKANSGGKMLKKMKALWCLKGWPIHKTANPTRIPPSSVHCILAKMNIQTWGLVHYARTYSPKETERNYWIIELNQKHDGNYTCAHLSLLNWWNCLLSASKEHNTGTYWWEIESLFSLMARVAARELNTQTIRVLCNNQSLSLF